MKIVRFNDILEIFHVPEKDECRYPDRDLIEKKRRFEDTAKRMDSLLKAIHLLKLKFPEAKKDPYSVEYFESLKSLSDLRKSCEKIFDTENLEMYVSSEDDSSNEFSDNDDQFSDNDSLEIIFE